MNNPIKCLLWLFPLLLFAARGAPAAPMPDADVVPPGLTLILSVSPASYVHDDPISTQGEPIEITMRYQNTGPETLSVEDFRLVPGMVINELAVQVVDAQGHALRGPDHFGAIDRISTSHPLTLATPFTQTFTLNDWIYLDHPGHYTVMLTSRLVHRGQDFQHWGPAIALQSAPLALNILPASPAWRHQRQAQAETDFRQSNPATRFAAIQGASYWDDPAAIPLLMRGLEAEETSTTAQFGLTALLDIAPFAVKAAVRKAFNDPARLISPRDIWPYLSLLTEADKRLEKLDARGYETTSQRWRDEYTARLVRELPHLPPARAVNMTVEGLAFGPLLSWDDPANWRRVLRDVRLIDSGRRQSALIVIQQDCRLRSVVPNLKRMLASLSSPTDSVTYADYRDAAQAALDAIKKQGPGASLPQNRQVNSSMGIRL